MAIKHDLAALLIQKVGARGLRVPGELRFAGQDLPAPETLSVPTSEGPVRCTVYRPVTAEHDRLRDEGDAYALVLAAAGVPVTHRMVEGVHHFFTHKGPVEIVRATLDLMAEELIKAFTT